MEKTTIEYFCDFCNKKVDNKYTMHNIQYPILFNDFDYGTVTERISWNYLSCCPECTRTIAVHMTTTMNDLQRTIKK